MGSAADFVIVGGGPAGYAAALRAARLGARTVVAERDGLGGTCVHRGCIPTKALLEVARVLRLLGRAGEMGVRVAGWTADLDQVRRWRDRPVRTLARGVETLLAAAGVEVVRGEARVLGPGRVAVRRPDGEEEEVSGRWLLLAPGSVPAPLPVPGGEGCWDSDAAVALPEVPSRLAVVGGGPVGVELASIYAALGARVTVIEVLPRLLPAADPEVSAALARALARQGVAVRPATRVRRIEGSAGGGFVLHLEPAGPGGAGAERVEAERVLAAVGRRPAVRGLGLDRLGLPEGWVAVDETGRTAVPGVLAAGDVTGRALLAHFAAAQGMGAVAAALGHPPVPVLDPVPWCVFTWPEAAGVGLTEEEARARAGEVLVGRFPFGANGRAAAAGEREGFVKVVAERSTGRLLGVHVFGPDAATLVHEGALALAAGLGLAAVERVLHAHPTLSEAFAEACLAAAGRAVHLPLAGPGAPPGGGGML